MRWRGGRGGGGIIAGNDKKKVWCNLTLNKTSGGSGSQVRDAIISSIFVSNDEYVTVAAGSSP